MIEPNPSPRRQTRWPQYVSLLVFDLIIGYLGYAPFVLAFISLRHVIREYFDWPDHDRWFRGGTGFVLFLGVIIIIPLACVFIVVNRRARGVSGHTSRQYWAISTALAFLPLLVLYLQSIAFPGHVLHVWTPDSLLDSS